MNIPSHEACCALWGFRTHEIYLRGQRKSSRWRVSWRWNVWWHMSYDILCLTLKNHHLMESVLGNSFSCSLLSENRFWSTEFRYILIYYKLSARHTSLGNGDIQGASREKDFFLMDITEQNVRFPWRTLFIVHRYLLAVCCSLQTRQY